MQILGGLQIWDGWGANVYGGKCIKKIVKEVGVLTHGPHSGSIINVNKNNWVILDWPVTKK